MNCALMCRKRIPQVRESLRETDPQSLPPGLFVSLFARSWLVPAINHFRPMARFSWQPERSVVIQTSEPRHI
jgi:hypothetical protein